ncbi:MAG TPA: pyridoxal phosphate-dependent aminotransferase [Thermohalobaculum sp.]|nr:pyridoxal phosphate-dependent aminotransferase [Thermohalobaculum sp.]
MSRRPPPLTPLAASLPATVPFVGPEEQERARGEPFAARLGANESVFGPSPRAVEAMRAAAPDAWKYADPESHEVREALAVSLGVPAASLKVGEGIDGLLGIAVRLFVGPGDRVVTSAGAYPTFNYHVAGFGGELITRPYRDDAEDPDALAAAAHETGARMVYLANPDNPMGSWHGASRVLRLLDALPDDCLLVLDEAYVEFAPEGTAPPLDPDDPRLIRFRTFSKAYGLAGLRIGYAIGHTALIAAFDRVRNHFGVNRQAQVAALAALGDRAWLSEVQRRVAESRDAIGRIAAANGLTALPSAANFVAVDCGRDGAFARRVLEGLVGRGVFVRMPGAPPLDRCIRISAGREEDLAVLAEALPAALADAGATVA